MPPPPSLGGSSHSTPAGASQRGWILSHHCSFFFFLLFFLPLFTLPFCHGGGEFHLIYVKNRTFFTVQPFWKLGAILETVHFFSFSLTLLCSAHLSRNRTGRFLRFLKTYLLSLSPHCDCHHNFFPHKWPNRLNLLFLKLSAVCLVVFRYIFESQCQSWSKM